MAKFQRHIFTCIHRRDPDAKGGARACCAARGSEEVAAELKRRLYEKGFKRVVRANKAGCLDQCERGVTMVVYPEAVWYGGVTVDDLDEIIERHVERGEIVERLVIPDEHLTGRAPGAPPAS